MGGTKTNKICTFSDVFVTKKYTWIKQKIREHTITKMIFKLILYYFLSFPALLFPHFSLQLPIFFFFFFFTIGMRPPMSEDLHQIQSMHPCSTSHESTTIHESTATFPTSKMTNKWAIIQ
jgi:hypothetical protein